MHLAMRYAVIGAALILQAPAVAQSDAERVEAWDDRIDDAYGIDWEDRETAIAQFLAVAHEAEEHLAAGTFTQEERLDLLAIIGSAYFGAAQHHDSERDDESDVVDREWLIKTVEALEPVLAARGAFDAPAYDFRGAAGQLFGHGRYYDLPEWREWSRMQVLGNRYMSERMGGDDDFERELLAVSLYEHGWLTSDQSLYEEADALYAGVPEGDRPYAVTRAREAVTAGEAPYPPAGSLF